LSMYLIDGNNLIGHSREISYHDPQARQKLLERVIPFLDQGGSKAVIFFDGGSQSLRKSKNIEIVFSGPKSSADEKIRQFVESSSLPKSLCVVTSDNSVYGYCRSCGARAMKCHEFNRLLRERQRAQIGKEDRDIRIDNLRQWLRYFGEEED